MPEKENQRKCYKCGCSPIEHNVKLFRFPKPGIRNIERCALWAKYVLPDKDFHSISMQTKLYSDHRMLCHKHFNDAAFTDETKLKLLRSSIPYDEEYLEVKQNIIISNNNTDEPPQITLLDKTNTQSEMVGIKNLIKLFKSDEIADKQGVTTTSGGVVYKPTLASMGTEILGVISDQEKQPSNNCNSASSYHENDEDITICYVMPVQDTSEPSNSYPPHTNYIQQSYTKGKTKRHVQQKHIYTNNPDLMRKQFYRKKLESAVLEKKIKLLEYRMTLQKQELLNLEIKIKQKEYEILLRK